MAKSIAVAAAHPLGVGDALYRHAREAAYVDTVPFGAWRRTLLDKIGGDGESMLANEDYEVKARLPQAGGENWAESPTPPAFFCPSAIWSPGQKHLRSGFSKGS